MDAQSAIQEIVALCRKAHEEHGVNIFAQFSLEPELAAIVAGTGEALVAGLISMMEERPETQELLAMALMMAKSRKKKKAVEEDDPSAN